MEWKKHIISTLLVLIVLLALDTAKCIAARPKPYLSETYVVDDGGGKSHIVTQNYYDQKNSLALEPKEYALIMSVCVAMLAMSNNFHRRASRLSAMKRRCTVPVPAVVASVRSGRTDGRIRYRYTMYSAVYRYEYLGFSYESGNGSFGRRKNMFSGKVTAGEEEEICINPDAPEELFDFLAQYSLQSSRFAAFLLTGMGIVFLVVLLFR